ncbi:hypothetical protein COU18_02310 [Candidatus Kaiserbacteria bacterium CG10_big_fil_rev_8_21_14_0_10_51_14]|uniref:Uncharacterized protein n=1 Tax=Candidatus Kaiserbacteria bacterium CG10_big_fil_rev_8_21_14_0_10_51_14 TaxID=1974610 RepID=A0A2H0UDD6_9BACT|nr:MAG: hypothetical protein COU18_02310 [Candidatus Kaiserbacteria bacterium CG10_big_fil_rev_8_21_14_0_10_51_14]
MTFAIITFALSFLGIMGLFGLKDWETRKGRVVFPEFRTRADALALRVRGLLLALEVDLEKIPVEFLHIMRVIIHTIVLYTASFLRILALQAHRLADFVSHKHTFRRRAPRSEFLKKVLEHKNENGAPPDTLDTKF